MTVFTRKRVVAAAFVAAFVAVFAVIGAVSNSSPTAVATTTAAGTAAPGAVPSAGWYWTMAVSPTDASVLVLGTSSGLYRSGDGGKTWQATGPKGLDATSVVRAGSSLIAGGVSIAATASPVIRNAVGREAPAGPGVLLASTDGGETWQALHPSGLPSLAVQALAVDPASSTTLYALLTTGKLYRSTDGARTFTMVTSKIGVPPWALVITQNSHFVAGDMDSGSYVSTNGKAWQRVAFTNTQGSKMVMEYAVQPSDSTRVLMSAFGLEMSTDSGKTWQLVLKSQVMFGPVAWAANPSGVAYAVGFDGSLWRSDDGGTSWKKVT